MKPAGTGAVQGPTPWTTMAFVPLKVHPPPATVTSCPPKMTYTGTPQSRNRHREPTHTHTKAQKVRESENERADGSAQRAKRPSAAAASVVSRALFDSCCTVSAIFFLPIWAAEAGGTTGRPSNVTRSPGWLPVGGATSLTTEWSGDDAHAT